MVWIGRTFTVGCWVKISSKDERRHCSCQLGAADRFCGSKSVLKYLVTNAENQVTTNVQMLHYAPWLKWFHPARPDTASQNHLFIYANSQVSHITLSDDIATRCLGNVHCPCSRFALLMNSTVTLFPSGTAAEEGSLTSRLGQTRPDSCQWTITCM